MYKTLKENAWEKGVSAAALVRHILGEHLNIPESERNPRPYRRKRVKR